MRLQTERMTAIEAVRNFLSTDNIIFSPFVSVVDLIISLSHREFQELTAFLYVDLEEKL